MGEETRGALTYLEGPETANRDRLTALQRARQHAVIGPEQRNNDALCYRRRDVRLLSEFLNEIGPRHLMYSCLVGLNHATNRTQSPC